MGFSSGLPLLLTGSVLQAWLIERGVNLATIGLLALVGLPYTLKFLWAPVFDRFIWTRFGRRRGWILILQLALSLGLIVMSLSQPSQEHWGHIVICSFIIAFFSASQDIVIDAYRRESLLDEELGLGSALYVNGYRLGMLLAGGGGLILADLTSFSLMYQMMASCMGGCILISWLAKEPPLPEGRPTTLKAAFWLPLRDYFQREGALTILGFILLYKIGDVMASSLSTPFYLGLGFSKTEIGSIVKLFGFVATLSGGLLGGMLIMRIGMQRALIGFGAAQLLSTLGFVALAYIGHDRLSLAILISAENFTGGMSTAAFVGFMASLTERRFTATQYALLSSLMGIPRVLLSAPAGWLALSLGWPGFFLLCTVLGLPGLLMVRKVSFLSLAPRAPL